MAKKIKISCIGSDTISIKDLKPFQGSLKELTELNFKKCKNAILELGFSEPFSVWKDGENSYILNGHMRLKTLIRMEGDGYKVPKMPISYVDCKDEKEAKKKVLSLTSQFGEMSQTSLIDFCMDADIDVEEVREDFRFPEIDYEVDLSGSEPEEKEKTEKEDDGTTTIRVKVLSEDRDNAMKNIEEALSDFAKLSVL